MYVIRRYCTQTRQEIDDVINQDVIPAMFNDSKSITYEEFTNANAVNCSDLFLFVLE